MWGCRTRQGDCRQSWLQINVSPRAGYGWTAHWWAVYNKTSLNARQDRRWGEVTEIKKKSIHQERVVFLASERWGKDESGTGRQKLPQQEEGDGAKPHLMLLQSEGSDCETTWHVWQEGGHVLAVMYLCESANLWFVCATLSNWVYHRRCSKLSWYQLGCQLFGTIITCVRTT